MAASTVPSDRRYDGKTLADLANDRGLPQTVDSGIQLAIELQLKGGFSAIYHSMDEEDVKRILRHPLTMIDTDGDNVGFGGGAGRATHANGQEPGTVKESPPHDRARAHHSSN